MNKRVKSVLFATSTIFITFMLIIFPRESFDASVHGIHVWGNIVFPSLFPFFVAAELLISFGVIQFARILFEPIMRPLFNVSGAGSIALILGTVSGYPTGAKISVSLRKNNLISRSEAERLVSFSNASSPLFIFGAIAIGIFNRPEIGIILAISHYTCNIIVGICMRFYQRTDHNQSYKSTRTSNRFKAAFKALHATRIKNEQPLGKTVTNAILSSVKTLIMIGGFIILFSVLTTILQVVKIDGVISSIAYPLLMLVNIPPELTESVLIGLFEISIGSETIASMVHTPLMVQVTCISFILGFNGFSVQAQVASLLADSDIRFYPYFIARIFHAIISSMMTLILARYYFSHYFSAKETIFFHRKNQSVLIDTSFSEIGFFITFSCLFLGIIIIIYQLYVARKIS